jgi:membrane associated rhomboid family serine protease
MLEKSPGAAKSEAIELRREVRQHATILGTFVGSMWILEVVDTVLGGRLDGFGIRPRTASGLLGILFAPFLHGGFGHLIANSVPLLVLGFIILQRRKRDLLYVSLVSGLVAGLGTWLIGASNSVHIGASSLVFGYLGYLISRSFYERRLWSIVTSLFVFFLYGGALFGILPNQPGISWQGHLFGLVGGILSARLLHRRIEVHEKAPGNVPGRALRR